MSRPLDVILAEWRAAERSIDPDHADAELVRRAERLRQEYAQTFAANDVEAHDLARHPLDPPEDLRRTD